MQVKQVELYTLNELPEDIQEKVINEHRYDDAGDISEIYKELEDSFETLVRRIRFTRSNRWNFKVEIDPNVAKLTGKRAIAYLENNLFDKLRITRSEYLQKRRQYFDYGTDYRPGKIKPCPLTGMCFDHDFLDSMTESIHDGYSIGEAFEFLQGVAERLIQQDEEYKTSDEYVRERLDGELFFASGKRF